MFNYFTAYYVIISILQCVCVIEEEWIKLPYFTAHIFFFLPPELEEILSL